MTGPREWPPVSVWLMVGWLLATPAGLAVTGSAHVIGLAFLFGLGVVACPLLLGGHPAGHLLAFGQGAWCGLLGVPWAVLTTVLVVWGKEPVWLLATAAAAVSWPAALFALIWWPETRRWCGDLPADPDADPA